MDELLANLDEIMAREILAMRPESLAVKKMTKITGFNLDREQQRARDYLETGAWPNER